MSKQAEREHYYRLAKRLGFRSRAAFKLIQLDRRFKLLKRGDVVVDLGAAPGGWLQVARELVGPKGFVVGVDLQPIERLPHENVVTLVADITDPGLPKLLLEKLPRPADVVLSDASPKISGVWSVDHARSVELARAALSLARSVLAQGGDLLIKVFQGDLFPELVEEVKRWFSSVKVSKPSASRKGSAEAYVIARGFRGTPAV